MKLPVRYLYSEPAIIVSLLSSGSSTPPFFLHHHLVERSWSKLQNPSKLRGSPLSLLSLLFIFFCQCELWTRHRHILLCVPSLAIILLPLPRPFSTVCESLFCLHVFRVVIYLISVSLIYMVGITGPSRIICTVLLLSNSAQRSRVSPYPITIHSRVTSLKTYGLVLRLPAVTTDLFAKVLALCTSCSFFF